MPPPVLGRSCRPRCRLDRHEPECSNTAASWPLGGVTPGAVPPARLARSSARRCSGLAGGAPARAPLPSTATPPPPRQTPPTQTPPPPPAVAADWRALPLPAHRCLQRPCRPTRGKPGQSNPTDVMHNDQSTYQLTYDELIGHTT